MHSADGLQAFSALRSDVPSLQSELQSIRVTRGDPGPEPTEASSRHGHQRGRAHRAELSKVAAKWVGLVPAG